MIGGIILGAGKGTRMKSNLPKVLHKLQNKPLIEYVVESLEGVTNSRPCVVVGYGAKEVEKALGNRCIYAFQSEQKGTGDAVKHGVGILSNEGFEDVFILCGDAPLITGETLTKMISLKKETGAKGVVLSAVLKNSDGYGRVIRDDEGKFLRIVEEKDATSEEKNIREVNSGTYLVDFKLLEKYILELKSDNAQHEFYLTNVFEFLKRDGFEVALEIASDSDEIIGINDRLALCNVSNIFKSRRNLKLVSQGVEFKDINNAYIGSDVIIGDEAIIGINVEIEGKSVIEKGAVIGSNSRIVDSRIGSYTNVDNSIVLGSVIGEECQIGPFAYIRPGSRLANKVKIGDFVEVKKSEIGTGSKLPHHSYIGDAKVGTGVNIGAGTITCNYDGANKSITEIGDGAFIGSNSNLVAPVKIGRRAYVAAGSTITKDVEDDSLSIARGQQVNKDNWERK